MYQLLKADFYRIKEGQLGLYAMVGLVLSAIFLNFTPLTSEGNGAIIVEGLSAGSLFVTPFFISIFFIVWSDDLHTRTINNVLLGEIKRSTYFQAKLILSSLLALIYILVFDLTLFISVYFTKGSYNFVEVIKLAVAQLPVYLVVMMLGILLFNFIDQAYIASSVFLLLLLMGESVITLLVSTFLPFIELIDELMIFTSLRTVTNINFLTVDNLMRIYGLTLLIGLVFLLTTYHHFNQREFK